MLKVAMLSKWHVHAEGYARDLLATGKVQITCVWDEKPQRGAEWAERLGVDFEAESFASLWMTEMIEAMTSDRGNA